MINVKDYGAIGNGINDDTASVVSAVSAVNASSISETLFFPAGIYVVNAQIALTVQCAIKGESCATSIINTTYAGTFIIASAIASNFSISDLTINSLTNSATQLLISVDTYTNQFFSNLTINGPAGGIYIGPNSNYIFMNQIKLITNGCAPALQICRGGGDISNLYIIKSRNLNNTGPAVSISGQITSLQISNSSIAGIGTPSKQIINTIANYGSCFVVGPGSPVTFAQSGELCVITGTGTVYDGVWPIATIINPYAVQINATTGGSTITCSPGCYIQKPECSLYYSNVTGAINEVNLNNVLLEGIDSRSIGSFAAYFDAAPGAVQIACHNINNCFFDSGESGIYYSAQNNPSAAYITEMNVVGGNLRYIRHPIYINGITSNMYQHSQIEVNVATGVVSYIT